MALSFASWPYTIYYYEDAGGNIHATDRPDSSHEWETKEYESQGGSSGKSTTKKKEKEKEKEKEEEYVDYGEEPQEEEAAIEKKKEEGEGEGEGEGGGKGLVDLGVEVTKEQIEKWVQEAAKKHEVDPNLIKAMMKAESSFDPKAVSEKGAQGLMQLMPGTAKDMEVTDPFDPKQNIGGGAKYIAQQLKEFGSLEKALAAYNAGPSRVREYGGVPPFSDTQKYIKDVLKYYKEYSEGK